MYKFSRSSATKLQTCHKDLQTIFEEVIKYVDCTILEGARTLERQKELVKEGKSKTLKSMHIPGANGVSMAVDVAAYPIDWDDEGRNYLFAGLVLGIAKMLKYQGRITHELRLGADWDRDLDTDDQTFDDLVHFELR